ncbi:TolC family protein [Echinicola jeungdonensis]|uniref:TolC family protein n=1 Tax=Echinicola jeungdonensis TaxID=709343 RepID=A0ABV5J621_9BACT|nr:TolC family protein [Echinicola jeungdonensis]MDN3668627.1 TolC family protein [Echinicola jeungdonensis]
MIRFYVLIIALVGITGKLFAQEELTFEKAVIIGLENNYDVKIALQEKEIAVLDRKIGTGALLPSLDASYGQSTSREDVEQQFVNDSDTRNIDGAKSDNENFSLNAIYGFRADALVAIKRLGKLEEIGVLQAKVVIENTVAAISSAYYRLVLEKQRYVVLQKTLELSKTRLDIAKSQYELGSASKRAYLAAQVDYNSDLSLLLSQEQVIKNARINLNELLVVDPPKEYVVNDTLQLQEDLVLGDLLDQAFDDNKDLLIRKREENVAYLQVKELQAQRLPTLTLDGTYRQSVSESDAGFLIQNKREGLSFGATIGINLFNGFILNRRIQRAKLQQTNQAYVLDQYENQLRADIYRAFNIYVNGKRRLEIEMENYEVVEENTKIAFDRFKSGLTSYLEFRDAQVNSLEAETRLIDAVYSIKEAEIELKRLSGDIYQGRGPMGD